MYKVNHYGSILGYLSIFAIPSYWCVLVWDRSIYEFRTRLLVHENTKLSLDMKYVSYFHVQSDFIATYSSAYCELKLRKLEFSFEARVVRYYVSGDGLGRHELVLYILANSPLRASFFFSNSSKDSNATISKNTMKKLNSASDLLLQCTVWVQNPPFVYFMYDVGGSIFSHIPRSVFPLPPCRGGQGGAHPLDFRIWRPREETKRWENWVSLHFGAEGAWKMLPPPGLPPGSDPRKNTDPTYVL